jgi:ATP-dependent HslUV protease subunit HslV
MTTIAYRNGILAADSQVVSGNTRVGEMRKVWKTKSGALVGFAGNASLSHEIEQWVEKDLSGEVPSTADRGSIILVRPTGEVFLIDDDGGPVRIAAAFYSEGSGADVAIGALAAGASAVQAVEIASIYDIGTGGPIQYVELGNVIKLVPPKAK